MAFCASVILKKVRELDSFTFLKKQIILILIYACTCFYNGLYLLNQFKQLNFWSQPRNLWYKVLFGICIETLAGVALTWLFWNLAFTYWVSAKQLKYF